MTWKKEKWLKGNPKRDKVVANMAPVYTVYFIRAPKPWFQSNGWDEFGVHNKEPSHITSSGTRYSWIECIHPICVSASRHKIALVLHQKQTVGKPKIPKLERGTPNKPKGPSARNPPPRYNTDPLYRLVDCKKETTISMPERVKQCSKMKGLRFRMTEEQKRSSLSYWTDGKTPELEEAVMEPPTCAAQAKIVKWKCNTCCCKAGVVSTSVTTSLIAGSQNQCGSWFAFLDYGVRMFVSLMRINTIVGRYSKKCYNGATMHNPNTAGSPQRKQYCSEKMGGNKKHLHSCGGSEASSAITSSTEVQDLGEVQHEAEGRRAGRRLVRRMKMRRGGLMARGGFSLGARVGFQGNHEEEEEAQE